MLSHAEDEYAEQNPEEMEEMEMEEEDGEVRALFAAGVENAPCSLQRAAGTCAYCCYCLSLIHI